MDGRQHSPEPKGEPRRRRVFARALWRLAAVPVLAAFASVAAAGGVMLDGFIDPPAEYVHQLPPIFRSAEKGGLDMFLAVSRSKDGYNLALKFPTKLTAADFENDGGFSLDLYTSVRTDAGGRAKALILHIPAEWPLGQKIEMPGGVQAIRNIDRRLGALVVEVSLPNGSVAVDVDNQPEVRLEIANRNAARGNDNVGTQVFPADPEKADQLGLGRLPDDPQRAALLEVLGEFDRCVQLCAGGDAKDLDNLLLRSTMARLQIKAGQFLQAKAEVDDLIDRLDWLADEKRIESEDAGALQERLITLQKILRDAVREAALAKADGDGR